LAFKQACPLLNERWYMSGGLVGCSQNWIDSVLCDSFPASDPPSWISSATTAAPTAADIDESDQSNSEDAHPETVEEAPCSKI
jgi:hypothetical protein